MVSGMEEMEEEVISRWVRLERPESCFWKRKQSLKFSHPLIELVSQKVYWNLETGISFF